MFDVTNKQSFENLPNWFEQCEKAEEKRIIYLCGNKIDLEGRLITKEEAEQLAKQFGTKYFEVSAKTGEGIEEMFNALGQDIVGMPRVDVKVDKENENDKVDLNKKD